MRAKSTHLFSIIKLSDNKNNQIQYCPIGYTVGELFADLLKEGKVAENQTTLSIMEMRSKKGVYSFELTDEIKAMSVATFIDGKKHNDIPVLQFK